MKKIILLAFLISLLGCQTQDANTKLSSGTWVGYGFGVTENTGRLSR